jgi:hypothetical protein
MSSSNTWEGTGNPMTQEPRSPRARYDLRPLSTGEILDRTFQIYRSRFTLFAGLAVLPAAVSVITEGARLWYSAHQSLHTHSGASVVAVQGISAALLFLSSILSLILYGITHAATTWAVSNVYLSEPASIPAAFKVARQHWFRYTLIVLRQAWIFMWVPLVLLLSGVILPVLGKRGVGSVSTFAILGGVFVFLGALSLIYGFWAYIRVSLSVPASVVESLGVSAALKRSKQLLVDRKGRIFLLFLLLCVLYIVIMAIQMPLAIMAVKARGSQAFITHAIRLALSFATTTLIGPVGAIALCLFYFDERVRREGFDIEWMMSKVAPAPDPNTLPASGDITAAPLS